MFSRHGYVETYYRFQRPIFITFALLGLGSFNFLFFSLVFVSLYHGTLAGAGTILGVLVVAACYYFVVWISKVCAANAIGQTAEALLYQIRTFGSVCRLIIFE
jgi:hypothetical protein